MADDDRTPSVTLREVRALLRLLEAHDLIEIELERGGERVRLRRQPRGAPAPRPAPTATPAPATPAPAGRTEHLVSVEAPMVGTFYRAPSPEAAPYVREGDLIKPGQALCIIEAMKLMNEIESKVAGRVVRILAENGQPVEYGQPLFLIEPPSEGPRGA